MLNPKAASYKWLKGVHTIHHDDVEEPRARRVPRFAFPRSRIPGVLGTRARGNAIFFKARGNAEREEVGTLISRAWSYLKNKVQVKIESSF